MGRTHTRLPCCRPARTHSHIRTRTRPTCTTRSTQHNPKLPTTPVGVFFSHIFPLQFYVYGYFICLFVYVPQIYLVQGCQKRADPFELPCGCCDSNSFPRQEQRGFLTELGHLSSFFALFSDTGLVLETCQCLRNQLLFKQTQVHFQHSHGSS